MPSDRPVAITFGSDLVGELKPLLAGRRFALVTSPGMVKRGGVDAISSAFGSQLVASFTKVDPNPSFEAVARCAHEIGHGCEVVVGLGGGSVLDTAKAVAAVAFEDDAEAWLVRHVRNAEPYPDTFAPLPVIAIPTTAGTGSEVTMWGSLWDSVTRRKYSISHPRLYPEHALVIPALTYSLSYTQSLFPALDALSHALEAMWSRNASPAADAYACEALRDLAAALADDYPNNYQRDDIRRMVQKASVTAGRAMSLARTSLAHSISYPMTARLGVPHGLACSFTLPEIIRANAAVAPERMKVVAQALGQESTEACVDWLYDLFGSLDLPRLVRDAISDRASAEQLRGELITKGKASNNLGPSSEEAAWAVLERSLERLGVPA